jgi:Flp pilus assembly protein TadG
MNEPSSGRIKSLKLVRPLISSVLGAGQPQQFAAGLAANPRVRTRLRMIQPMAGNLVRTCLKSEEDGAALVEFGVVFPIMMIFIMAIFMFGIALNNYIQLTDAVGIAGRALAISQGQTTDPCSTVSTALHQAAPGLNQASLSYTYTINGNPYSGTTCTGAVADLKVGVNATINVTYPLNITIWGKNPAAGRQLQASITELVQ